jgi:hypothetical protein
VLTANGRHDLVANAAEQGDVSQTAAPLTPCPLLLFGSAVVRGVRLGRLPVLHGHFANDEYVRIMIRVFLYLLASVRT